MSEPPQRMHPDARSQIASRLRATKAKLKADYIERSLDHLEWLWPHLEVGVEKRLNRAELVELAGVDSSGHQWSEQSASRFLHYLDRCKIVYVRNRGKTGLGITLRVDLSQSPWISRREPGATAAPTFTAPDMPPFEVPELESPITNGELEDETVYIDQDDLLRALSALERTLAQVRDDLEHTWELEAALASEGYKTKEHVLVGLMQLARIRAALLSGDKNDLLLAIGLGRRLNG